ncbi:hypothetical protein KY290_022393 [Solanum tuberosum]|uniref:BCNT-C domain-containing protein n=1 Tax=Solanum tuberosum TaxID=4113 RepID=A0ABQ7V479_SOLTU|nr:hypothetical protein KY290_022393 [Solanum tuberosum]
MPKQDTACLPNMQMQPEEIGRRHQCSFHSCYCPPIIFIIVFPRDEDHKNNVFTCMLLFLERKARVDAVWEQMNKGVSTRTLYSIINKPTLASNKASSKSSSKSSSSVSIKTSTLLYKLYEMPTLLLRFVVLHSQQSWMTVLGLSQKKTLEPGRSTPEKRLRTTQNDTSEESKKLAAAALSAVKEAATAAASAGRGKVITEVRDFAGEDVEIKKYVDANSAEASDKGKGPAPPASAVDIILEQIKKKQKLSVLDKTKKDWEGFKGENRGMEEELDAYKKSSNQYLDRVGFLERADYREFERERDARLAMHAKRKPESMREDY